MKYYFVFKKRIKNILTDWMKQKSIGITNMDIVYNGLLLWACYDGKKFRIWTVVGFECTVPMTCMSKLEWVRCKFLWYLYEIEGVFKRYLMECNQVKDMLFILIGGKFLVFFSVEENCYGFWEVLILSRNFLNHSSAWWICLRSWATAYLGFLLVEWNIMWFAKGLYLIIM